MEGGRAIVLVEDAVQFNWCALVCAFVAVMLMCFWNVRLWSNVTSRNLAC